MSKRIIGLLVLVWLITFCKPTSTEEEDTGDVEEYSRIKRKVSYYHPFLKDEKLSPEMQTLLKEVLERKKRALHKTRKNFRQFRNNSLYYNAVTPLQKSKKFLSTVDLFTLPTTKLGSIDDSTVSLVTKPMSFWLRPLSSEHEHIPQDSKKKNTPDLNYLVKNHKQSLFGLKKDVDLKESKNKDGEESVDSEEKKAEEASDIGAEIQGSEDVLGLENSKDEDLNKVIDEVLKDEDADSPYDNSSSYSRKREVSFPFGMQPVNPQPLPFPLNINREVSVLTKPSFYWLNQNKQLVNSLLLSNSLLSNLTSAKNMSSGVTSGPSNPRILFYEDSSPLQTHFESSVGANTSSNQSGKPHANNKLELTPLEALGLNRSTEASSKVNISNVVSLTTKASQYWIDLFNTTKNATNKIDTAPQKAPRYATSTNATAAATSAPIATGNTASGIVWAKPINISAEVSLLTKPSSYWTDPFMKNTTEAPVNVSVTRSIGHEEITERVKLMTITNVISMTNKPARDWISDSQGSLGSVVDQAGIPNQNQNQNTLSPSIAKQDPSNLNIPHNADMQNLNSYQNKTANHTNFATGDLTNANFQNMANNITKTRSAEDYNKMPVIRQPYAINEVPKKYFKQKEANKTNKNENVTSSGLTNLAQNVEPLTNVINSLQTATNSFVEHMSANSLQGQAKISQDAPLSMPKMLPEHELAAAQPAVNNLNMNPQLIQNEAISNLPQAYYTGAPSQQQLNGNQNVFWQSSSRNNISAMNEAHSEALANTSEFPKPSFLNEENLVENLEAAKSSVQYHFPNNNAIENPQFRNEATVVQNAPQISNDNVKNKSLDQNNVAPNEAAPQGSYQNQNVPFTGNENGNLNSLQINQDSAFIPPFQNLSFPTKVPLHKLENITNGTQYGLIESQNNKMAPTIMQNSASVFMNQNVAPLQEPAQIARNLSVVNAALVNGANNQVFGNDNMQTFANNSISRNTMANETSNQVSEYQSTTSFASNSIVRNQFSANLTDNQMYHNNDESLCQGPGCSVSSAIGSQTQFQGPSSSANNDNQMLYNQFQGSTPFANKASGKAPSSTNSPDKQMFTNASQLRCNGPGCFVNNSLQFQEQSSLLSNSPATNSISIPNQVNNQMSTNLNNQMYYNQSPTQPQGFANFANKSFSKSPMFSNEADRQMLSNISPHCQGPGCSENGQLAAIPSSVTPTINPVPFGGGTGNQIGNRDANATIKAPGEILNNALNNISAFTKERIFKPLNRSITTSTKNTTEHDTNRTLKRNLYYNRFGEPEPFEIQSGSDDYQYLKRDDSLDVDSDNERYLPHKYWKREISDGDPDEEVENDENFNADKASAEEFEEITNHKRKKSPPIEISVESDRDGDDDQVHKSIKRDFPVEDYETENQDYPEKAGLEYDDDNDKWEPHKSIKRDFANQEFETNNEDDLISKENDYEQDWHDTRKRDFADRDYDANNQDGFKQNDERELHKSIKRDFANRDTDNPDEEKSDFDYNEGEEEYAHKSIKRDFETNHQDDLGSKENDHEQDLHEHMKRNFAERDYETNNQDYHKQVGVKPNDERDSLHNSFKRDDFANQDYDMNKEDYPEKVGFEFQQNDEHKSVKRDFADHHDEINNQDNPEYVDYEYKDNNDGEILHRSIKRDFAVNDDEMNLGNVDYESQENDEPVFHKTIKRESPVSGDELDDQENPDNVEFASNDDDGVALIRRGSILKDSLKSRSDGIETNEDSSQVHLDPNLENPKFQNFLQHYILELAESSRKRSNGLGGTTEIPSLVQALQNYLSSSYNWSQSRTTALTTKSPLEMSSLDIIDMNSLLRTVDVMPTVDRYGYTLEEPSHTKPTTEFNSHFDFKMMSKMPFILQPQPQHLAIMPKFVRATPSQVEAIVKSRNVATPTQVSKKPSSSLKNFDAASLKEMSENDLLTLWNVVRKYHVNDKLPCNGIRQIYDSVDDIRKGKMGRSSGIANGMNCNFNGSWLSTIAGMRIDLNQTDDNRTFTMSLASKTPPAKSGLLYTKNCTDWVLSGKLVMKKTSILRVTGVNEKEKKLAVFLGECRVCNDKSLVYGHWIVLRESRDCEDIFSTQESYTDVWRSEGLHTLRMHNLEVLKMSLTTTEKTTTPPYGNGTNVAAVVTGGGAIGGIVTSVEPPLSAGVTSATGEAPLVGTGLVQSEGTALGVQSTAATHSVNIVVGKKRIAIKQ